MKNYNRFTAISLSFSIIFLFSNCNSPPDKINTNPSVKKGILDLSTSKNPDCIFRINGEWGYFPDVFVPPERPGPIPDSFVNVPGNSFQNYKRQNFGTYYLKIKLPRNQTVYGLKIQSVCSAYTLYINGKEYIRSGTVSDKKKTEIPDSKKGIVILSESEDREYEVLLHVSTFNSKRGERNNSVLIGPVSALYKKEFRKHLEYFILMGAFIMIGLYHLNFYLFRRKEKASRYFSFLTIILALRIFFHNYIGYYDVFPLLQSIPWPILKRLEYLTSYLPVWGFILFYNSLFKTSLSKRLVIITTIVTGIAVIPVLFFPYSFYSRLVIGFQIYTFIGGIFITVDLLLKVRKKNIEASFFLIAFSVFFAFSLLDILTERLYIDIPQISPVGYFIFIFLQGLILSRRYSKTYNSIEGLSRDLNRLLVERKSYEQLLEKKVMERTSDLEKAMAEAKTANKAKGEFLARMSHEIRTPLNGILGFAEIIRDAENKKEKEKYSGLIITESERLLELINQLLDISKIDAGEMSIDERPFHFSEFIQSVTELFTKKMQEKNVRFNVILPSVPAVLFGDQIRLRQVLVNLLGNALKFTEKGEITLEISETFRNKNKIGLLFIVKDTGIGIPLEKQGDIFKDFVQADSSITRKYGGTGLGTSIAKSLVEMMSGTIGMTSQPDEGSSFWFELQFPYLDTQAAELIAMPVPYSYKKLNLSVLLAEDYFANQEIATRHLEKAGCRVHLAENGKEAVALFKMNRYDIICMDIHMPEMDGFAATRAIRKLPDGDKVIIIGLTADAYEETRKHCLDAGMNDVITKPFRKSSFLNAIGKWTGQQAELDINDI